jgi:hypothetical protein
MGSQTFLQNLALPLMQRNLIGAGRDPFPETLDIVDLIFDREVVES